MALLGPYLRDFHVAYEHFVGGLSIITNTLLIYLAIRRSNSHIRKYSVILIISSVIDLIFNTFGIIFSPIVEIQQGKIFLFLGGPFEHLPPKPTGIICMTYLVSIFCTVINIPMQFFYRYTAVCLNHQLTISNYLILYLLALPVPIAHCIWGYYVFYPHGDVVSSHLPLLKADPVWGTDTPTFFVADQKDHYARMHFVTSFVIVGACYVVVTITGLKIYLQLRKLQSCMSRGNVETQGQLTKILLIQAIIPFVCLSGPVMIGTAFSLLSISIPLLGYTMTFAAMWLPVVNSVSAILIVPNFRRFFFFKPGRKDTVGSTTRSVSRLVAWDKNSKNKITPR
ncbi:unnamed protein product [Bursaphelenchus xylophilus]|uniref:(pine wood nematode) hypothetical protein n=1 Tax=Bursaphelenchus xylophilus TaxID=6326 RepID=A0A1I7SQV1_BURXY|nr:unnamed protein product [Bursaphelenchus xylophilus]CAG9110432.1 unnamed protein product [Bursaphelenchus xylophilus]